MLKSETGKTDTKSKWPSCSAFCLTSHCYHRPPPPRQIPREDAATRKNQKAVPSFFSPVVSLSSACSASQGLARDRRGRVFTERDVLKKIKNQKDTWLSCLVKKGRDTAPKGAPCLGGEGEVMRGDLFVVFSSALFSAPHSSLSR